MTSIITQPIFINEENVKRVLSWKIVNHAVKEALKATSGKFGNNKSYSHQPARTFTSTQKEKGGVLLSMPGFVGDYNLDEKCHNTLACKLVTCFNENEKREPPLPNILANILLFDSQTGELKSIIQGTEITAWRTAAASIVSTDYLYFRSGRCVTKPILSIIGCGVQGRIHAIGFASSFDLSEIRLWNRTELKTKSLASELEQKRDEFINKNIKISIMSDIVSCVSDSDIIVTATFSSEPLFNLNILKSNVHINAIGAGINHHSEISQDIYDKAQVYIDNWASAKTELKDLKANIVCEVGEIIIGIKSAPDQGLSIFQSMGMASEDAVVAQMVFNSFMEKNQITN